MSTTAGKGEMANGRNNRERSREALGDRVVERVQGLIAFQSPLYQVLSLPVPISRSRPEDPGVTAEPVSLHAILKNPKKEDASHEH